MREIKFRAWNVASARMYSNDSIKALGNLQKLLTLNHVIVMQYVGLKDIDGKEIYEGDIIKDTQGIAFVRWYSDRWMLESPGSQAVDEMTPNGWVTCEVIGNIYENPELLSGSEV